jgi:hypothetical protein
MTARPNSPQRALADTYPMRQRTVDEMEAPERESDTRARLNVVILYDAAEAGRRAISQLRRATEQLDGDFDVHLRLWRLDMLTDATVGTLATADLAGAELLVLSLDKEGRLEAHTRERFQDIDFLRSTTEGAGLGYLFPARSMSAGLPFTVAQLPVTARTAALEGVLNQSPPRALRHSGA